MLKGLLNGPFAAEYYLRFVFLPSLFFGLDSSLASRSLRDQQSETFAVLEGGGVQGLLNIFDGGYIFEILLVDCSLL